MRRKPSTPSFEEARLLDALREDGCPVCFQVADSDAIGRVTVANAGSLGLPTDGDPRASYAVIEDGEVRLERFAYPIEETVRAIEGAFDPPTVGFLSRVLRTGKPG